MANTKYTTVDQIQTVMTAFANKADERFSTTSGEKACYDESTALYAHAVGDIVYVGNHFYKVTAAIAVGDTISTSTNITADTGIPADTPIYIEKLPSQDVDIPTKVSDLTNDLNFQTDSEVSASIASAIAGITEFDYQIVAELPASGTKGIIYLVPNSGSGQNVYDEYIWIVNGSSAGFEKFGEKTLTVVEYKGDGTYTVVVDGTGVDAGKKIIELSSAVITSLGLADSALQSVTSTGSTITVTGSGTTKNLEVASSIVSGASAGATAVQPGDLESAISAIKSIQLNVTLDHDDWGPVSSSEGGEDTTARNISILPYNFRLGSAVVYNNEIYILGSSESNNQGKFCKWNGSAWGSISYLPIGFYDGSAVIYNNEIHILGSNYNSSTKTKHYKYDGTSWTEVSTLPYEFTNGCAIVLNNEIHILGGWGKNNHYKWNGSTWSEVSTLPYTFHQGSAVVYNDEIHILGGSTSGNYTKHYKWNGSSWSEVSTLLYNFYRGSAVVYNNEIHILGGSDSSTKHYKWNGSSWSLVSTLTYSFYDGSAVIYNNEIHILGGTYNVNKHYEVYKYTSPIITQIGQTITSQYIHANSIGSVDISSAATSAQYENCVACQVQPLSQSEGSIIMSASSTPTEDIPIIITIQGS